MDYNNKFGAMDSTRDQKIDPKGDELCALRNELAALRERVQYLESLLLNCSEPSAVNADFYDSDGYSQQMRCAFCKDCTHSIHSCEYFGYLQVGDRWNVAKKLKLCFRCLNDKPKHLGKDCPYTRKCGINFCKLTHNELLHDEGRRHMLWNLKTKQIDLVPQSVNRSGSMEYENNNVPESLGTSDGKFDSLNESETETLSGEMYFSDLKNPTEFVKSMFVYESNDSDVDSLSECSGGENNQMEEMTRTPPGIESVSTNISVPCLNKDMDISMWLQPEQTVELMDPLKPKDELEVHMDMVEPLDICIETLEAVKSTVNGVELSVVECTAPIDPHGKPSELNADSLEPFDGELGLIEALGYSMRNLKPSECADSGRIEMDIARCVEPPDLNGPPFEQDCSPPAGIAGMAKRPPENVELLKSKGMLLATLSNYLQQIDEEIQYYEGITTQAPPAEGFSEKQKPMDKLDKSKLDLSMWLMPIPKVS